MGCIIEQQIDEPKRLFSSTLKAFFRVLKSLMGDCRIVHDFLKEKPDETLWIPFKLVDAVLRGIAQVCFANNPISGLFIAIGIGIGGCEIVLGGLLGTLTAILTAFALDQSRQSIELGMFQFNACLVGTVITSLYPTLYGGDLGPVTWTFIAVLSALSVAIQIGLSNILRNLKTAFKSDEKANSDPECGQGADQTESQYERSLVCLTFPFNVVTILGIFCLISYKNGSAANLSMESDDFGVNSTQIDWISVGQGIVLSGGQVYASMTVHGSVLVYVGLSICSLKLAVMALLGATSGSLAALFFSSLPRTWIYQGLWGYSPILTSAALGHTFYKADNWRVALLTILGCILTTAIQAFLIQTIGRFDIPTLTMPFVFATWLLMIVNSKNDTLKRI